MGYDLLMLLPRSTPLHAAAAASAQEAAAELLRHYVRGAGVAGGGPGGQGKEIPRGSGRGKGRPSGEGRVTTEVLRHYMRGSRGACGAGH